MNQDYSLLIDRTEWKVVKWYLRSPESGMEVVILVAEDEDLAEVARTLDCEPEQWRERALALARREAIRFAVDEPAAVRPPCSAYTVALDEFDVARGCLVSYSPPA